MSDADGFEFYDLEPVPEPVEPPGPVPQEVEGVVCKQCSYDLSGLVETGVCPECGLAIERSLTEDFLEFSAPAYLKSLHIGVVFIQTAIVCSFLLLISNLLMVFWISPGPSRSWEPLIYTFFQVAALGTSLLLAAGWWLFSSLDPAFTGRRDGSTARKLVRITTLITAGIAVVLLPLQVLSNYAMTNQLTLILSLLSLVSLLSWATGFFAAMVYLRWLTPRLPNWHAYKRAKLLMWLCPILYTVGWLCVGLGPLVALILYWNMLNWIRLDLRMIRNGYSIMYRVQYSGK